MVSGELIPDSDSDESEKEAVSGADEATSPAMAVAPVQDTNELPASRRRIRKEPEEAEAPVAASALRQAQGRATPRRKSAVDSRRSTWRRHLCIRYVPAMVYPAVSDVYLTCICLYRPRIQIRYKIHLYCTIVYVICIRIVFSIT